MPSIVPNPEAEQCLRDLLEEEGYDLSYPLRNGETGVDIKATKGDDVWHIEVIGYKSSPPARSKDFYEVFFRAVSRLDDDATHCVIAIPEQARAGLPQRVQQYQTAWRRIAKAFPELEIWLVDVESKQYSRSTWGDWL